MAQDNSATNIVSHSNNNSMQYPYRKQMQRLRLTKGSRKDEKYISHRGKGIPERLHIQFDKI